jgi:hypothetical protein
MMRFPIAVLLPALALVPLGEATAERLDKEACEALKAEQARLVEGGAKADMERGPEWGKANLAPDRLKRIERLLEVEEGLAFRCPQPRPAPVEVEARSAPAAPASRKTEEADAAKSADAEKRPPVKRKAVEPAEGGAAARSKRAAAGKEAASGGSAKAEDTAPPATPVKPAAKRKTQKPVANDAYSPPPGTGSTLKIPGDAEAGPWKQE